MELLTHNAVIAGSVFPQDINGAGADGDWVSLANTDRVTLIALVGAQAASSTITLQEASDASGTGAAAMAFNYRLTPANSDQFGALTAATSAGVDTDGTTANVIYAIEVKANELTSGNTHVRLRFSSPGAAAVLVATTHIGHGARVKRETMPTALT